MEIGFGPSLNFFEGIADELTRFLEIEMIRKLEDRGFNASGELIESVQGLVRVEADGFESSIRFFRYGQALDTGVSAEAVRNRSRIQRPGEPTFLERLERWVRLKRLTDGLDRSVKTAAFFIRRSLEKRGIPKDRSRINYIEEILKENDSRIESMLSDGLENYLILLLDEIIASIVGLEPI